MCFPLKPVFTRDKGGLPNFIDEPLAGLDEKTQDLLIGFLKSFHNAGKTLITITHNKELASTLGTKFAYMNEEHELEMR